MIRWYHNPIVIFFTVALGVMLAMWGYDRYRHPGPQTSTEQQAAKDHAGTQEALVQVARVDTLRLPALVRYRYLRLTDTTELGRAADTVIVLDSLAIARRDTAFAKQGIELETWKAGCCKPPRLQAYGEALYDVLHMVPVGRVGATFKVIGPISLSAAGEYAAPPVGKSDPAFRVTAGLKYNF